MATHLQKPRSTRLSRRGFEINLAIPTFALVGTITGAENLMAVDFVNKFLNIWLRRLVAHDGDL